MRNILFGALACLCLGDPSQTASAQYWADAELPSVSATATVCITDTVHNALYVSGHYPVQPNDTTQYFPFYRYQNGAWDLIGKFDQAVFEAVVYRDTLIVSGIFTGVNDTAALRVAYFDGDFWHPYGSIGPPPGMGAGSVLRLRVIDDELYALGEFDEADGQACHGMVKRVGSQWFPPEVPFPAFYDEPRFLDIAMFQGNLVLAGNFSTADLGVRDLIQLNGSTWEGICDCLHGSFDGVNEMAVYKGELYACGAVSLGQGDPWRGVIRWDGTTWRTLGDPDVGLQLDDGIAGPVGINTMIEHDSLLFLGGHVAYADHLPVPQVVTWDGTRFCAPGGFPGTNITVMAFYQDTLFASVQGYDGPAPNYLAKYIGDTYQMACSSTGLGEVEVSQEQFTVLQDADDAIHLLGLNDGTHTVMLYDAQGRLALTAKTRSQAGQSQSIKLSKLNAALYVVRVDGRLVSRFVPLR